METEIIAKLETNLKNNGYIKRKYHYEPPVNKIVETALFDALIRHQWTVVSWLIKNIGRCTLKRITPTITHTICYIGDREALKFIKKQGLLDTDDYYKVVNSFSEAISYFAPLDLFDEYFPLRSSLHIGIDGKFRLNNEFVKYLYSKDYKIRCDYFIHSCYEVGNMELVQFLIHNVDHLEDMNIPLHWAIKLGDWDYAKQLLENHDKGFFQLGASDSEEIIYQNKLEIMKLYLERLIRDPYVYTWIMYNGVLQTAEDSGTPEMVRLILQHPLMKGQNLTRVSDYKIFRNKYQNPGYQEIIQEITKDFPQHWEYVDLFDNNLQCLALKKLLDQKHQEYLKLSGE